MADVVQDGMLGLDRASRKFDPEMGFRFSTYATLWIRQAIQRGISVGVSTIRLPPEVASHRARARARLAVAEHEPTSAQLAEELNLTEDELQRALDAAEVITSLDRETSRDDESHIYTLLDSIAEPGAEDAYDRLLSLDRTELQEALAALPGAQRLVLALRFGLDGHTPRSLAEVAKETGRSTTAVQSSQREALNTLRNLLNSRIV